VLALKLIAVGSVRTVAARTTQIVGLLAFLGVAVTVAGCNSDGGTDLRADFSSRFEQPNTGPTSCPVTAIHFQDRTMGGPTAWEWTFDDGSTSSEQDPDMGDQRGSRRGDPYGEARRR
jgi:hypothetical protein